jgi:putative oxidoreductase
MGGFYESVSGLGYPFIRAATGLILVPHGMQKLFGFWGGNIDGTAGFFAKIGLEPAMFLAYWVACFEFFGGLLLIIGLWTRPVALVLTVQMFIAAFLVHLGNGFFWGKGGYEYPLLWGLITLGIFLRGAGNMSVDGKIGREF